MIACIQEMSEVNGGGELDDETIAGLELDSQSKGEIKAYMDEELKGYRFSENEDAISYTQGAVSYTFSFTENDMLKNAVARNNV